MPEYSASAVRILDAAEQRFAAAGYRATSLAEIADDLGIRAPSLYKHFDSKQALYLAVMQRLLDPYFAMLGELLAPAADAASARTNLRTVARHYARTPNLARLIQHAALAGGEELAWIMKRWLSPFLARAATLTAGVPLLRGADARDVLRLIIAFHAMLSGYVTLAPLHARMLGGDPLSDEHVDRYLALLGNLTAALWKD
jgi:TetR/AcrR family transcriptional regulator